MKIKEWETERDYYVFDINGFQCEIIRHPILRHLCGYVYLESKHPFHGKHYNTIDVEVHGGLTFAGSDGLGFKIGFDCAHYGDLVPGMEELESIKLNFSDGIYRNVDFVKNELKHLVEQLAVY